jgi:hypothetical protein
VERGDPVRVSVATALQPLDASNAERYIRLISSAAN